MHHELPQILPGRHYLAWIAGGFLAGIFYGIYAKALTFVPFFGFLLYSAAFLLFTLFLLVLLALPKKAERYHRDLFLVWFLCLAFVLGILRVYVFELMQGSSLKATATAPHTYTGVILTTPEESDSGKSLGCTLRVTHAEIDGKSAKVNGKLLLYAPKDSFQDIHRDDTVIFSAQLNYPAGSSFPGGFSFKHYLYRQGIFYSVYAGELTKAETPVHLNDLSYRLELVGRTIRESAFHAIDTSFGSRTEEAALLKGIMLGSRESFADAQYTAFVDSGLVHITAASGMHVLFLFGFLTFLLRRLRLPRLLIRLVCVPVFLLFGAAAAFTPSINRAIIMMLMLLLAEQLQQTPDSLTSLSFAALVLGCINPYIVTGYSFLLSFAATLGVIVFSAPLQRFFGGEKRKLSKPVRFISEEIKASVLLSLSSNLGLGYLMSRFFNRFSWGAILGNILIVPLASLTFLCGFLLWGLSAIYQPLASIFAQTVLWIPLWFMNCLAEFFSMKFFRFYLPTPHLSILVVYLCLCGVFYSFLTQKKR